MARMVAKAEIIETAILMLRGQRVILDSDLAELYGVTTGALNQAVARNSDRFPGDFSFVITPQEFATLLSQNEHGVAMLSSVLKSNNVEIMRAFVRLRRLLATPGELIEQINKLAESVQLHDEHIQQIARVLQQLIERPKEPSKGRIGFQTGGDP